VANPKKVQSAIRRVLRDIQNIEGQTARQVVAAVNNLRQNVILILVEQGEIDVFNRDIILNRLESTLHQYADRVGGEVSANQRRLFVRGIQIVDESLRSADLIPAVPHLSETMLEHVQRFTADLITNITDDVRHKIRQQVDLAVLGQKPVGAVINEVGRNLKDPSIFGTIAKRAQVITETETKRIQRMSTSERLKQVRERFPKLKKRWNHAYQGTPRPGHLALDGTVIGVDEKFRLIGEDGQKYDIDAPYDPILPAGEIVNCRCFVTPDVGEIL
jgi:uncharacterized ubiquitin-like protein YukD